MSLNSLKGRFDRIVVILDNILEYLGLFWYLRTSTKSLPQRLLAWAGIASSRFYFCYLFNCAFWKKNPSKMNKIISLAKHWSFNLTLIGTHTKQLSWTQYTSISFISMNLRQAIEYIMLFHYIKLLNAYFSVISFSLLSIYIQALIINADTIRKCD